MALIVVSSRRRGASSPTTCSPFPEAARATLRRPHTDATIAASVGKAPSTRPPDGEIEMTLGRSLRRGWSGAVALLVVLAAAIGCASGATVDPRPASGLPASAPVPVAPKPFVFAGTTATSVSSLPLWMGLASGYFAEEGLDL